MRSAARELTVHERTLARIAAGAAVLESTSALLTQRLVEYRDRELKHQNRRLRRDGNPEPIAAVVARVMTDLRCDLEGHNLDETPDGYANDLGDEHKLD